jgi:murein DD-endopeptidase MepM/ murein hydrolase activator NlpD
MHEGIDIGLPIGSSVVAAASGKIVTSGYMNGYGLVVFIEHADGYRTVYGHNSKLLFSVGDEVQQGQLIALSGNTGRSTGPHLHFEVQKNGQPMDPMKFLQ